MLPDSPGNVHWSIGPLLRNQDLANALIKGPYAKKALIPPSRWLDRRPPNPPVVNLQSETDTLDLSWQSHGEKDIFQWVLYYQYGKSWNHSIHSSNKQSRQLPSFRLNEKKLEAYVLDSTGDKNEILIPLKQLYVTLIDRTGNESAFTRVELPDSSKLIAPSVDSIIAEYILQHPPDTVQPIDSTFKLGIEVLMESRLELLKDKKVGLITNPSAVTKNLQSTIDVLHNSPDVNLVALFGAEHGVRGARQGKIEMEGEPDPKTGIPVYSLYADSFAPKKEWLDSLDVLLFDIQGVGSAWYTFKYSMSFAMEACAEADIPMIILDRPNPLGGETVEGPYLNLGSIFRHPLPLRHGMTYGELALMWNETEQFGADVTVIQMNGYTRDMMWNDLGLPWIMPSPNMGTFETAVVYPGQCIFERMNMSEARGTTKPFLLTGAPWVDAEAAAADLNSRGIPGAVFRPAYFIPKQGDTGSNPRNKPWNEMCGGVEIILTNYKTYRSVQSALHIIDAYRKTSPDSLAWSPPEPIQLMDEGKLSVDQIVSKCDDQISDFLNIRDKFLLY
jgi:uncharacterized protein YbbC (DUF1343 family)